MELFEDAAVSGLFPGIVARQPGDADYSPPKDLAFDVTRAVKQVPAGEIVFRGFALRVMQDRSVDGGYLVPVELPNSAWIFLELEV